MEESHSDLQSPELLRSIQINMQRLDSRSVSYLTMSLLKEKVVRVAEQKNVLLEHLYHKPLINPDDLYKDAAWSTKRWSHRMYVIHHCILHNAIKEGKNILLEGQLGSLERSGSRNLSDGYIIFYTWLDTVQSEQESHHMRFKKIVTVCKAYSSAVGAGAFRK